MKVLWIPVVVSLSACGLPQDKVLHAGAGSAIYGGSRAVGLTPAQSLGACAAAGVAKEVYDSTGRGNVEAADALATALPCLLAYVVETNVKHKTPEKRIYREDVDLSPIRGD